MNFVDNDIFSLTITTNKQFVVSKLFFFFFVNRGDVQNFKLENRYQFATLAETRIPSTGEK